MIRRVVPFLVAAAIGVAALPAPAQTDQAKLLFNAGAQAYEAGQFAAAIQAFEQAYKLAARPGILFSIAQAHRKQFYATKNPDHLRAALKGYRDYLAQVQQGGRRSDAAEALQELEPVAAKLEASGVSMSGSAPQAPAATRVMVSSQTAGAVVALDGGKPAEAPLIAEVKPGKHTLKITAPGYLDETREIEVPAGAMSPVDIALKEKPGKLTVRAPAGAQVSLDGRLVAVTPLSQAVDIEPGRHVLGISKNGYRGYSSEIEVGRGESKSIDVELTSTAQRKASYVMFGVAGATAVAGGVLVALSLKEQRNAQDFQTLQKNGTAKCGPTPTDCTAYVDAQYTSHVRARDEFRRDAGVVLGSGLLVGAVGVALFALDFPSLVGATPRARDSAPKPAPTKDRPMEVSALPIVVPGFYGGSVAVSF